MNNNNSLFFPYLFFPSFSLCLVASYHPISYWQLQFALLLLCFFCYGCHYYRTHTSAPNLNSTTRSRLPLAGTNIIPPTTAQVIFLVIRWLNSAAQEDTLLSFISDCCQHAVCDIMWSPYYFLSIVMLRKKVFLSIFSQKERRNLFVLDAKRIEETDRTSQKVYSITSKTV